MLFYAASEIIKMSGAHKFEFSLLSKIALNFGISTPSTTKFLEPKILYLYFVNNTNSIFDAFTFRSLVLD